MMGDCSRGKRQHATATDVLGPGNESNPTGRKAYRRVRRVSLVQGAAWSVWDCRSTGSTSIPQIYSEDPLAAGVF